MKKCPFCAEEIQVEAIKCRYCGSFLSQAPPPQAQPAPAASPAPPAPAPAPEPAPAPPRDAGPPFARRDDRDRDRDRDDDRGERKLLYAGSPSWRAFIGHYVLGFLGALVVPLLMHKLASWRGVSTSTHVLMVLIPLGIAAVFFAAVHFYRISFKVRVTTSNIETEHGILSKKIDVLELWRCRDVRYQQSLLDRILGIAHIQIFTADVTTPQLEITGLPASRQLFERLRDSIEIQRQHRNVYGVVS